MFYHVLPKSGASNTGPSVQPGQPGQGPGRSKPGLDGRVACDPGGLPRGRGDRGSCLAEMAKWRMMEIGIMDGIIEENTGI